MADTSMSIGDRPACSRSEPELDDPDLQCKTPQSQDETGTPGSNISPRQTDTALVDFRALSPDALPDYDPEAIRAMAQNKPDYTTVSASATFPLLATVGVAASFTVDRYGHSYFGLSMGAGVGVALPVGVGATTGTLVHDEAGAPTTEADLHNLLCGDAVGAKGGVIAEFGVTNSAGGTAIETGVTMAAEVGVSFGHNWGRGCP
jgi:hypothetical protein